MFLVDAGIWGGDEPAGLVDASGLIGSRALTLGFGASARRWCVGSGTEGLKEILGFGC